MEKGCNHSEVARLLDQIETEYIASRRGLTGLAATARHAVIAARMEDLGRLYSHLQAMVGEQAIKLIVDRLERQPAPEGGM